VSIEGRAAWTREGNAGSLEVSDARLALAGGGTAHGSARWRPGRLEAQAKVADLDAARWHTRLQPTRLSGTLSAVSEADGQRFEVALADPRFSVEGAATLKAERLDVQAVRVKHGGGSVEGKGFMALAGKREFRFEGAARHFDPSAFVKDLAGDVNFDLVATGRWTRSRAMRESTSRRAAWPTCHSPGPCASRAMRNGYRTPT
jgi:autotransporter translocation and assembly factor TamB